MSFADQLLSYRALERLLSTLHRVRQGDFAVRMVADGDGVDRDVGDAINDVVEMLASLTRQFEGLAKAIGQGELQHRITIDKAGGSWGVQIRAVNDVAQRFYTHVSEFRRIVKAVHAGDLTCAIDTGPESNHHMGELFVAAGEANAMVSHLRIVASKLTEALTQLNMDGEFKRQCHVTDIGGAWILLVGSLNAMTASLGEQIQELTATAEALAAGNLTARSNAKSHGDVQDLRTHLNSAGENMSALCEELRRVTQLVVTDGTLSVDIALQNARGEWQNVQDSCNRAFGLIGRSVRAINHGIGRLLTGDYAFEMPAQAPGELGASVGRMTALAAQEQRTQRVLESLLQNRFVDTSDGGSERDNMLFLLGVRLKHEWMSAARVSVLEVYEKHTGTDIMNAVLARVAGAAGAAAAAYYVVHNDSQLMQVANFGGTAQSKLEPLRVGEGLIGKAAASGEAIVLDQLEGLGVHLRSGLIELVPRALVIFPLKHDERVVAVVELLFTTPLGKVTLELLEYLSTDLVDRMIRPTRIPPQDRGNDTQRIRELEEELLIATARLERLQLDLQTRDKAVHELQAQARELQDKLAQHPGNRASVF